MEYIISEKELRDLSRTIYNISYDRNSNREVKIEIEHFLKSKQPVKEVYTFTPSERLRFSQFKYTKYKIYIQKVKE